MKILALDLETGGLDSRTCGITEIAAVACSFGPTWEGPRVLGTFSRLVRPQFGLTYEPEALRIQGRNLLDLQKDGRPEKESLESLHEFLGPCFGFNAGNPREKPFAHVVMLAHNAVFDLNFLEVACKRNELPMPCNFLYRCSCQYFRAWSDARCEDRRSFKLDDMMQAFGVNIAAEDRHTATGDVRAMAECFGKMMRDLCRVNGVDPFADE